MKLGQTLQLFFRCAGKFDFASCLVENEAVIGNNHQMSANAKETTDFKHREHDVFVAHDEVIDRPDGLIFVVGDGMADQLARSIAFGDQRQKIAMKAHDCLLRHIGCSGGDRFARPQLAGRSLHVPSIGGRVACRHDRGQFTRKLAEKIRQRVKASCARHADPPLGLRV